MEKSIWFVQASAEQLAAELNQQCKNTIVELLGIQITEVGTNYIQGTMPADTRTFQPMGLIHGGANVVLAETLGSMASNLAVDCSKFVCLGQEVNANHLRGVSSGIVTGIARIVHKGRRSHVWQIEISDEQGRLTCISRLTMAVVSREM